MKYISFRLIMLFCVTIKHLSLYVINKLGDKHVLYSVYTPVYV